MLCDATAAIDVYGQSRKGPRVPSARDTHPCVGLNVLHRTVKTLKPSQRDPALAYERHMHNARLADRVHLDADCELRTDSESTRFLLLFFFAQLTTVAYRTNRV